MNDNDNTHNDNNNTNDNNDNDNNHDDNNAMITMFITMLHADYVARRIAVLIDCLRAYVCSMCFPLKSNMMLLRGRRQLLLLLLL